MQKEEWLSIDVHIKNNITQEIRILKKEHILLDDESRPSTYIWEEGNFSCDCNRHEFFNRALQLDNVPCGTGKYSVNLYTPTLGFFYTEF